MSRIVFFASEPLMAATLADIAARELGVQVSVIAEENAIATADLLVTAKTLPGWAGKTLLLTPKPQKIAALLTQISEKLAEKPAIIELGSGIKLLEKRRLLETEGKNPVELTEKEIALLLYVHSVKEASRDDILREVWGVADGVNTQTFETHLYRLRQKWREIADFDCIVASDKGYGWHE